MIHQLSEKIAFLFCKETIIESDMKEVYAYGLELLFATLFTGSIVFGLSSQLGIFRKTILLLIPFSIIRSYAGGYHAKTHFRCILSFTFTYLLSAYLMESIKNYKSKYIQKKELRQQIETLVGDFNEILPERVANYTDDDLDLQNTAFEKVLEKIKERDVRILILHLLENYSLKEISALLEINYSTALSIFNRTKKKIKSEMGDDKNEF